jgi:hypothetical protein
MFQDVDQQGQVKAAIAERQAGAVSDRHAPGAKVVLSQVSLCPVHILCADIDADDVVPSLAQRDKHRACVASYVQHSRARGNLEFIRDQAKQSLDAIVVKDALKEIATQLGPVQVVAKPVVCDAGKHQGDLSLDRVLGTAPLAVDLAAVARSFADVIHSLPEWPLVFEIKLSMALGADQQLLQSDIDHILWILTLEQAAICW